MMHSLAVAAERSVLFRDPFPLLLRDVVLLLEEVALHPCGLEQLEISLCEIVSARKQENKRITVVI